MIKATEELGPILSGRFEAADFRERVERAAESTEVVIDFTGVEAMSPSFADELFAKIDEDLIESGRVRFEHLDEDLTALARFVRTGRHRSNGG